MSNDKTLMQYNHLLEDDADVAAIVIRERLEVPIEFRLPEGRLYAALDC